MLNRIFFWLLVLGIGYGLGKSLAIATFGPPAGWLGEAPAAAEVPAPIEPAGDDQAAEAPTEGIELVTQAGQELTEAALGAATLSVEICIGLIGIMILWLGLLQVAKDAGMVDAFARMLSPLMRWLFPDVPEGHPAHGAILMNVAANVLGLDNAATPFGLKAMKELQELNPHKDTATNAMATFLTINTSSVTLVPITIVGYRIAAGSEDPAGPLGGIILATMVSTIVGVLVVRWLQTWDRFAIKPPDEPAGSNVENAGENVAEGLA